MLKEKEEEEEKESGYSDMEEREVDTSPLWNGQDMCTNLLCYVVECNWTRQTAAVTEYKELEKK